MTKLYLYLALYLTCLVSPNEQVANLNGILARLEKAQAGVQCRKEVGTLTRREVHVDWKEPRMFKSVYELDMNGSSLMIKRSSYQRVKQENENVIMGSEYIQSLWDINTCYNYQVNNDKDIVSNTLYITPRKQIPGDSVFTHYPGGMDGVFYGDGDKSVVSIIKGAKNASMEKSSNGLYVISAKTKYGYYKIWVDPNHGYQLSRAEITKEGDDLIFGEPLNKFAKDKLGFPNLKKSRLVYSDVIFKKMDGHTIVVSSKTHNESILSDGRVNISDEQQERELTVIDPEIDPNGVFTSSIPNGTRVVYYLGGGVYADKLHYIWMNGKPVADK